MLEPVEFDEAQTTYYLSDFHTDHKIDYDLINMEGWSELISTYPNVPQPKHLAKALHTADNLLSADLASFEIEWLVETLLYKPVGVLQIISSRNTCEEWLKNIAHSFKTISKIVIKYWSVIKDDSEKIVQCCMRPYDPQTKTEAINCLINVLKKPGVNVGDAKAQVDALEGRTTCKASLALLVGTICRYHPESVSLHYNRIWRIYLSMLQPTHVTNKIVNAVLQGIDGLLVNFGQDLPIAELNDFYDKFLKLANCTEPLLSILQSHAGLFKESLERDQRLRRFLWGLNSPSIQGALVAVYNVAFEDVDFDIFQAIIQEEIQPRMESESSLVRLTALRVAMNAQRRYRIRRVNRYRPDALEFQLRNRMISHEDAELLSLCLEFDEGYTMSLLEATILFFENIPESLRLKVVVQGILAASKDNRKVALNQLVELSCQDGYLERYSEVWRGILDPDAQRPEVFDETVHRIAFMLKSILDAPSKDLEQVLSLSSVLSFVLSLREKDDRPQYCELLKPILLELSAVLCVSPATLLFPKYVCVEMFENNSMLQYLLASFNNNTQVEIVDNPSVLQAIFNKDVVDTKLLIKAVSEMDRLLKSGKNMDRRFVVNTMKQILKLKSITDASTSDNRALLRNISMFAGEHGKFLEKEVFLDDIYFMEMKNKITINITNYELDLFRVLQISFLWEDPELLYCLLVIISANLRDHPTPYLQSIAWRCIHSLFKCHYPVNVNPVLQMCVTVQCVQQAIGSISDEINPEVKTMLCDSVVVMLRHNPGSETTVKMLTLVAEQLLIMIRRSHQPIYECGLDITRIFLTTLHDNHDFTIKYLPEILILMTKKVLEAVYNTAAELFITHIGMFEESIIKYIITGIIKNIKLNKNKAHVELILIFLKKIFDVKAYETVILVDEIFDGLDSAERHIEEDNVGIFVNVLQILVLSKPIFGFDEGISKSVITKNNCVLVNKMSTVLDNNNVDVTPNILKFLNEYASALIDVEEKQTIQCLCKLIESMPPSLVCLLKKDLSVCISTFKAKKCEIPETIIQSLHKWLDVLNIERLNEELKEKLSELIPLSDASNDFADRVQSLYVMSKIFNVPVLNTDNWTTLLMESGEKLSDTVVSNLLHVANKNLSVTAFENILWLNKDFVKKYLNVYFEKIVENSIYLETSFFVHFLNYFVDNYEKYQEYYDGIVQLMERIWPGSFRYGEKLAVASDFFRLPRDVSQIAHVQWVIQYIIEGEGIEGKIEMITILPGGEMYSMCYRSMAGLLPVRVSEVRGHADVLRALLDALARTGDHVLLNIVVNLAAADDTRGWWDNAIDTCMASLAKKEDEQIYDAAFSACKMRSGMGCYRRVLVPLLRHSNRVFCEKFTSKIIQEVLSTLNRGYSEPSNTDTYKDRVISYAKAFAILQVVIDKLSYESLKSGRLNKSVKDPPAPWCFVSLVCMDSVTLMDKVRCPDDATEEIRQACLHLQCAAYNCLTTAICKRRPSQKQYTNVFNTTAWSKIVDPAVEHKFQPRAYWGESRRREQRVNRSSASSSFTRTVRTRIFMTTLSENPLLYDLIPNDDDEEGDEDTDPVGCKDHPLDAHGCLTTITKLLHHASTLEHTEWLTALSKGLTSSNLPLNARWTLAQAVCYTEVDLKAHASTLIPALLELIAATPEAMNNKQTLNNLHIDILWTIIKWNVPELPSYNHLSISVQYLVHSCMQYRSQKAVNRRLLNTLNSLLQVYGTRVQVPWTAFEEYCNDNTENISSLLPIFQRILKYGIALPNLMPYILSINSSLWKNKLPEVFGLAFSLDKREEYLKKFWEILDFVKNIKKNISDFVKALLCAMRVCSRCCNTQLFKTIVDLAPKVENANCLAIIGIYLDNLEQDDGSCSEVFETIDLMALLDSDVKVDAMKVVHGGFKFMDEEMMNAVMSSIGQNCQSGLIAVRKQAFAVMLKVFQDKVQVKDERSPKRPAMSGTRILDTLSSNIEYHHQVIGHLSRGMFDADADISKMIRDGVNVCLSKDMAKRLAELFYLIFYYLKHDRLELSEYGYVFLDLLFTDIKQQDGFKNKKFREQPPPTSNINNECATFTSGVTNRQKQISNKNYLRNIDVEMALVDMLEVFLHSAKRNSQICLELCVQVMRRVQTENSDPRFDFGEVMAELLTKVLSKESNSLTPLYLEASRIFMNKVSHIDGFRDSLKVLRSKVRDENLLYLNTVYEDFILRKEGRNFVNFSVKEDFDVEMQAENQGFSIEGLVEVFGHLANWDDIRAQDKRSVEEELPRLLVEKNQIESALNQNFLKELSTLGYRHWFNKMAGTYCARKFNQTMIQYKQHWLADAQRWPTADFVTSAVIEAMRWPQETVVKACEIRPHECLAEWAGRLMIRAAYYTGESNQSVCRGDELRWCADANRRQLPRLALQCIERNKSSLMEDEALPWFHQKIQAHRVLALKTNDGTMLRKTLEVAVRQDTENDLCLKKLILQLRTDLGSLSKSDLDTVLLSIDRNNNFMANGAVTSNTEDIKSIYDIAMHYYDDQWDDNDVSSQAEIISSIIDIIEKYLNYNLSKEHNLIISVLLNKLTLYGGTLDEQTAKKILSQIASMLPYLDSFSVNHLKNLSHVFPGEVWSEHQGMNDEEALAHCKEYLRLICDPQYSLLQFCERLLRETDSDKWQIIFEKMKSTLFAASYGGTEYISLNNFKNKLLAIENATNDERLTTVQGIMEELMKKPKRSGLRLSQLSPQLTMSRILEEHHLGKLLALPPTLRIFKFKEEVQMFSDSIRRPCVVSVLLSNGTTKRYIIKTGEPMDNDASVQRAIALLPKLFKIQVRSYNVTTLTEESAIIECLEAHERLRDLMGTKVNIPDNRINDDSVVLTPSLALEQFTAMCNRLPVDTLRSAIESRCASTQEFISKKQVFLETLSSMTITNWLFGVGDRHLNNIMWSKRDGGICGVDWASVFQYGLREFVPARLTAGLLAVCDVKVLEARLQNILENLRQNQKLYEAVVRTSFYWKGRDFKELTYIKGILCGRMVSYQITKDVMAQSNILHKDNCIGILDSVFGNFQIKETYTVEEQVSCLLKHCTEPGLLAVVPSGWEAFL